MAWLVFTKMRCRKQHIGCRTSPGHGSLVHTLRLCKFASLIERPACLYVDFSYATFCFDVTKAKLLMNLIVV